MCSSQYCAPRYVVCWRNAAIIVFVLLFVSSALAQDPLSLFKNYFVTGDYVVAGVGLRGKGDATGLATGTITMPDANTVPSTGVPAGADIVAAFFYWATVESSTSSFAGQKGYFNGYAITGKVLGNPNAPVSWSAGGCSGSSQGSKTIRTYRTDVRPYLKLDANGKVVGNASYQVKLADSGSNGGGAPLTLGASLVIIYRTLSPSTVPLNAIVLYDGAYAPSNSSSSMIQPIVGFYQPSSTPVAKLTHIVGNGQDNKFESVSLNSVPLPSLYGSLPTFPGYYNSSGQTFDGSWDNPTWVVNNYGNAVKSTDTSASTSVVPAPSNSGCVSWGVVIMSTTVADRDGDGLLDTWEDPANQGYVDVNTNQWVALPGANPDVPDIFVQVDYLSSLGTGAGQHSHLPKKSVLDTIGTAFHNQNVNVHFDVGPVYQGDPYVISYPLPVPAGKNAPPSGTGGHAISESSIVCNDAAPVYCEFPGQAVISWKTGFNKIKSQNFWKGRKHAYHYLVGGHALGMPATTWAASGVAVPSTSRGTLVSVTNTANPGTSTFTVTIQTPIVSPPLQIPTSTDRVTITGVLSQPALNGTYYPINVTSQTATSTVTTTVFTITTSNIPAGTYTFNYSNEPQLALIFGGPKSTSGFSDIGGGDTVYTLGLWRFDDPAGCQPDPSAALNAGQTYCNDQVGTDKVQAGTILHELGHTLALTHGGTYYRDPANPSLPSYGVNCKSNFLSAMNYLFQIRGFPDGGSIDLSGQTLPDLSEAALNEVSGIGTDQNPDPNFFGKPAAHYTRWYAPPNPLVPAVGLATKHCDGTPLQPGEQGLVRVDGSTYSSPIDWNNDGTVPDAVTGSPDINFNGSSSDAAFNGFNDWVNASLRQIGARRNVAGYSGDVSGADIFGGGADVFGGGADVFGGGADVFGGGADVFGGGADVFGGGAELDYETADSTVDAPSNLTGSFSVATRTVTLNWSFTGFGQIRHYKIYRATGSGAFSNIATVDGAPPATTYPDTNLTNNTTYRYFVTAVNAAGQESGPSNIITITVNWFYIFNGFLSPLSLAGDTSYSGAFTQGKAIPAKWQLQSSPGVFLNSLNVNTLYSVGPLALIGGKCPLPNQAPLANSAGTATTVLYSPTAGAKGNSTFRYDTSNNQFIFNWDTKTNSKGCYVLELDLNDGSTPKRTSLLMQ